MAARKSLFSFLFVILQLFSVLSPVTAIGGWQTIFVLFDRWGAERSQTSSKAKEPRSPDVAPVVTSRRGDDSAPETALEARSIKNTKNQVDEVTMTSRQIRSTMSTPAFVKVKGRRSCLDEDDLTCISFVGRSPFL